MKVLLIEDDAQTAGYVARGLRELGHVVDALGDGRDGLVQALENRYDVLIVDRMLPGLDGLSVVKAIRAAGLQVPVLFLSAMGTVNDRVQGLDSGADDYLGKPFSFIELRARLNALLRRAPLNEQPALLGVGNLWLNRLDRSVRRGTRLVDLQPREFSLLEMLMLHAGQIVTRTMLLENVWDMHFDPQTNIVESHISRLRAKISAPDEAQLIHTVRGAGYMIRGD
ncbi:MAG: response regulator transcription factor [Gammaproteobacteria bacterium]|nr:response regulator transcription factor [Gammaproteobacteria bacterium]MBP6050409.1 response regulator transcription factor [Pseudomonadales bacterium]MBK6583672.1 response regulator transcription factor [Gammaproteobacteria bacterium]MBK7522011.1 response regulator transcription factor [Gammaproteobacteria bacterium]MBK7727515.1 response regulator transcription factor [Gammaproteobacteria bacterium]